MQSREYKNYLRRCRRQRPEVKEKEKIYIQRYRESHPDYAEKHRAADKKYYEKNRSARISSIANYNARSCRDPIAQDVCRYNTLIQRIRHHPDWYAGVNAKDCLIEIPRIKGLDDNLKAEYNL